MNTQTPISTKVALDWWEKGSREIPVRTWALAEITAASYRAFMHLAHGYKPTDPVTVTCCSILEDLSEEGSLPNILSAEDVRFALAPFEATLVVPLLEAYPEALGWVPEDDSED